MRNRIPFVQPVKAKGRTYYYFRRAGMPRVKLPGEPNTVEFTAAYEALVKLSEAAPVGLTPGSFHALIAKYRDSAAFKTKAKKTQNDYRRYLDLLQKDYGTLPVATMPRSFVMGLKDKYADTPRTANYIVQIVRLLLTFAVDHGWRTDNPALRPKLIKIRGGYAAATVEQMRTYFAFHPIDTIEHQAAALLVYTGQRGSDAVKMEWARYDGSAVEVASQQKTDTYVWIPAHRDLRTVLNKMKRRAKTILVGERGKPITRDYLTHIITDGLRAAGIEGVSAHSFRKSSAAFLAEAGAGDGEIEAILGQRAAKMARYYRQQADRKKMARTAMQKWEKNVPRLSVVKQGVKPGEKTD